MNRVICLEHTSLYDNVDDAMREKKMELEELKRELECKRRAVERVCSQLNRKYIKQDDTRSVAREGLDARDGPCQSGGTFDDVAIQSNGPSGKDLTFSEDSKEDTSPHGGFVDAKPGQCEEDTLVRPVEEDAPPPPEFASATEKKMSIKERRELEKFKLLSEPLESTPPILVDRFKMHRRETLSLMLLYIKRLLHQWDLFILNKTDEWRLSKEGQQSIQVSQRTHENLKPFFQLMKRDQIPDDVLRNLLQICSYMQQREYVKANDVYLRLAIGNAPWPIGVTMVGIHERSAREKIHSNQVAHVLNDETQRKWIQSIKRLMTFCQSILPPSEISRAIG
jgi:hypothetical protein